MPQAFSPLIRSLALVAALAAAPGPAAFAAPPPDGFADLAERLLPSVVSITSVKIAKPGEVAPGLEIPNLPFPPGSPMEKLFRDFMDKNRHGLPGLPKEEERRQTALGSGFIIDATGYIVTNNHVIEEANEITATLEDGTILKATLVGTDPLVDLALLKVVSDKPLPAVPFGDSSKERVGDWVIAIGNPLGLSSTVTAGIVSARGRDIKQGRYDDFIQTDASINQGNSGGPLFNMAGEVIGINTAILSRSGGSIGLGFSIPSNQAKGVIAQLRDFGRTRRGWLGVKIQQVTPEIAESFGLKEPSGALIASTEDNGPAAAAQIKGGDIILKFNGSDIKEMKNLPRIVADTPVGKKVDVVVWRDGHETTLSVTLGELPDDSKTVLASAKPDQPAPGPKTVELAGLGLKLGGLTPESREKFQLSADQKGVVIIDVTSGSTAADKGLKPGDVIVEVQQEAVNTPAEITERVERFRKAGRKTVLMLVQTSDGLHWVPLSLTAAPKGSPG